MICSPQMLEPTNKGFELTYFIAKPMANLRVKVSGLLRAGVRPDCGRLFDVSIGKFLSEHLCGWGMVWHVNWRELFWGYKGKMWKVISWRITQAEAIEETLSIFAAIFCLSLLLNLNKVSWLKLVGENLLLVNTQAAFKAISSCNKGRSRATLHGD